jgi:hypothetical protein
MTAGYWAVTFIHTNTDQVSVKVTQERWEKTRKMVRDIWQEFSGHQREVPSEVLGEDSAGGLDHKHLEGCRCVLVYMAQAYSSLVTYLKGIHLTLDIWREDRNEGDWKRLYAGMEQLRRRCDPEGILEAMGEDAPPLVMHVPRLEQDLQVLLELRETLVSPERAVIKHLMQLCYSFGDAS